MVYLECSVCSQQYFGSPASARRRRCPLCRGRLSAAQETQPLRPGRHILPVEPPPVTRAEPGTFPVAHGCYPSLFEFALDDSRRLASPERDFGLAWRAGRTTFRAAYVEHTGELYLVQLGPPADGGGHVRVLGRLAQERLDATLAGWQDECGEPESLLWLTGRFFGTSYLGPH